MSDARLGELLVEQGKLTPEELRKALEMQRELGGRLGTNLLELGVASESAVLAALGELRSTRTASGAELRGAAPEVVRMIPAKLARRYRIVPYLKQGKTLFIASRDLGDALIEDEIRMLTGCMVRSCLALEVRVHQALEAFYRVPREVRHTALARRLDGIVPAPPRERRAGPSTTPASTTPKSPSRRPPAKRRPTTPKPAATPEPDAPPPPRPEPPPQPAGPLYVELDAEDAALLGQLEAGVAGGSGSGGAGDALRSALPWMKERAPEAPAAATVPATGPAATPTAPEGATATPEDAPEEAVALGMVAIDLADPALPVEDRLHLAAHELQKAEIRDEIADVLLAFAAPYLDRRLLLIHRKDRIAGWRGEGEGVLPETVRAIEVADGQPSVFLSVSQSDSFWLGPLPPLPANRNLLLGLGGGQPRDCIVLPVTLRSKVVCYLYGDNRAEGVAGAPVAALRRLVAKAGIAFEVYILKNKIRMM